DLSRPGNMCTAGGREKLLERDAEMRAGGRLDVSDQAPPGDVAPGARGVQLVEYLGGELGGQRAPGERAVGDHANQSSLERADVVADALREHGQCELVGELDAVVLHALAQYREARGALRRGGVGDGPRVEAL